MKKNQSPQSIVPKFLSLLNDEVVIYPDRMILYRDEYPMFKMRPLWRIIKVFVRFKKSMLTREEIIEALYKKDRKSRERPASLFEGLNAVKALCRARKIMRIMFPQIQNLRVEWFPFDKCQKKWAIFEFKPEHPKICFVEDEK